MYILIQSLEMRWGVKKWPLECECLNPALPNLSFASFKLIIFTSGVILMAIVIPLYAAFCAVQPKSNLTNLRSFITQQEAAKLKNTSRLLFFVSPCLNIRSRKSRRLHDYAKHTDIYTAPEAMVGFTAGALAVASRGGRCEGCAPHRVTPCYGGDSQRISFD